ncbi:MAG: type II toxin-antitoxin system RelE family toxin [Kiritimatiellia bacterium]
MSWDYKISERALKQLKKLDKPAASQIIRYLDERIPGTEDPRQCGKQFKGELNNIWRYRIGDYRILCQLQDEVFIVLILQAGHRQDTTDKPRCTASFASCRIL